MKGVAYGMDKTNLLQTPVEHLDIKVVNVVPLIEMMGKTAFQARNLAPRRADRRRDGG
jgi:hypothetical protein